MHLPILDDPILNDKAFQFYYDQCMQIIIQRSNRFKSALDAYMGEYKEKPLDSIDSLNFRLTKYQESLNQGSSNPTRIQSLIDEIQTKINNYDYAVPGTDKDIYRNNYIAKYKLFFWPSLEETAIQNTEKQTLLDLVNQSV